MCSEKIYIFKMSELGIFFSNSANKWPDSVKIVAYIRNGKVKKKQKFFETNLHFVKYGLLYK